MFFPKVINFFINIPFALLIKLTGCFTIFAILSSLIIRAAILVKNLKNVVKQCVSYSNFTIFLNIWKILVFNNRTECFFHCFHIFLPLCLRPTKKLTNQCVANIWEIRSKCGEKKMWHSHFFN